VFCNFRPRFVVQTSVTEMQGYDRHLCSKQGASRWGTAKVRSRDPSSTGRKYSQRVLLGNWFNPYELKVKAHVYLYGNGP